MITVVTSTTTWWLYRI